MSTLVFDQRISSEQSPSLSNSRAQRNSWSLHWSVWVYVEGLYPPPDTLSTIPKFLVPGESSCGGNVAYDTVVYLVTNTLAFEKTLLVAKLCFQDGNDSIKFLLWALWHEHSAQHVQCWSNYQAYFRMMGNSPSLRTRPHHIWLKVNTANVLADIYLISRCRTCQRNASVL